MRKRILTTLFFITQILVIGMFANTSFAFFGSSKDLSKKSDVEICEWALRREEQTLSIGQSGFGSIWSKPFFKPTDMKKYVEEAKLRGLSVGYCFVELALDKCWQNYFYDGCDVNLTEMGIDKHSTRLDTYETLICLSLNWGRVNWWQKIWLLEFAVDLDVSCDGWVSREVTRIAEEVSETPVIKKSRGWYSEAFGKRVKIDVEWADTMLTKLASQSEKSAKNPATEGTTDGAQTITKQKKPPIVEPLSGNWMDKFRNYVYQ
jgi:hypothetical protein